MQKMLFYFKLAGPANFVLPNSHDQNYPKPNLGFNNVINECKKREIHPPF